MSISLVGLEQIESNLYEDNVTKTKFVFVFSYDVADEEARELISKHFLQWIESFPSENFFGRSHTILETGYFGLQQ